jgi:hypothetical protein
MEDSDSPPPKIIIEADSWLQDTENSEIGGGNGDEPNVSEESAEDGSKEASHDPNNKAKDEFWLGFVVTIVIVVLVLAAIIVLDIIGTSMYNPPDWMMDEGLLFGIILFVIPAMILGAFAKGHNRFAQGSLALIVIPLLLIEVFKKDNTGKISAKEVAESGLVVLLISVIVWPVLPFLLGIEGYENLFWLFGAFLVFSLGVIVLIAAGIMKIVTKKKQVEGTTPSTSIIIEQIKNEPEPFSWKQYGLGAAIPTFLLLIPIIIFYSIGEYGYADWQNSERWDDDQLVKLSNSEGTEYIGEFKIDGIEVNHLEYVPFDYNNNCGKNETHNTCYNSIKSNDGFSLIKATCKLDSQGRCYGAHDHPSRTSEEVGNWNRSNGTIIFDEGQTHGESIIIEFDIQTYPIDPSQPERGKFYAGITGVMCFITPILSLIAISAGFSTGRAGLGYGGVTSLILHPIIALTGFAGM